VAGQWFSPGFVFSDLRQEVVICFVEIIHAGGIGTWCILNSDTYTQMYVDFFHIFKVKQGQCKAWRIPSPKNLTVTFDLENQ
jgi:hypothetical protein